MGTNKIEYKYLDREKFKRDKKLIKENIATCPRQQLLEGHDRLEYHLQRLHYNDIERTDKTV